MSGLIQGTEEFLTSVGLPRDAVPVFIRMIGEDVERAQQVAQETAQKFNAGETTPWRTRTGASFGYVAAQIPAHEYFKWCQQDRPEGGNNFDPGRLEHLLKAHPNLAPRYAPGRTVVGYTGPSRKIVRKYEQTRA